MLPTIPTGFTQRMVDAGGGVRLCAQAVGDPGRPAVLLLGGAACTMDHWPEELCRQVATGGRYVVRYDMRDSGRSTSYPLGEPGYVDDDLVADAFAVLDAHGADTAALVGVSMGGGLALRAALAAPRRVRSLVLVATTPELDGLAPPTDRFRTAMRLPDPDWDDPHAVADHLVDQERLYAGTDSFDEVAARALATRVVARTAHVRVLQTNHVAAGSTSIGDRLGEVDAPTLVVHGSADPVFPLQHGEVLAAALPRARLLVLDGVGHQVPPAPTWRWVVHELLANDAPAPEEAA